MKGKIRCPQERQSLMQAETAVEKAVEAWRSFIDAVHNEDGSKKPEYFDGEKLRANYAAKWNQLESEMRSKFDARNMASLAWMICEIERARSLVGY